MDEELSEQGKARRDAILQLAVREAKGRRRVQLGGRLVLVVGMLALIVGVRAWSLIHPAVPVQWMARVSQTSVVPVPPPPAPLIEIIQTDPTIADRLAVKPSPPRWKQISDQELIDEMAAAGKPTGIICMNGKTTLLPR